MPASPARYDTIGVGYASQRRAEPQWEAAVLRALGDARRVVNVGAGAGSYEPTDRVVIAVEPSVTMLRQRRVGAAPVVRGVAEALPFGDASFDAALAVFTTHHWTDARAGLAELRRVARRQVIVTWDPAVASTYWLSRDYLPELDDQATGQACLDEVVAGLDVQAVEPLAVPAGCVDGVFAAHWRRPAEYLDPDVRAAISGLALLPADVVDAAMARLDADLRDGTWARRHERLLTQEELDVGYRLVLAGR